jgi:hypothetical protein
VSTLLAAQDLLRNQEASHKEACKKTNTCTKDVESKIVRVQKELKDLEASHRLTLSQQDTHINHLVKDGYELKEINRALIKQVEEQNIKIQE